jgi:hypothetical protein
MFLSSSIPNNFEGRSTNKSTIEKKVYERYVLPANWEVLNMLIATSLEDVGRFSPFLQATKTLRASRDIALLVFRPPH